MSVRFVRSLLLALVVISPAVMAQNVIEDGGVGMTRQEVEYIVRYWTPQMQRAAAVDAGDRIELLNMALATKKIALQAATIDPAVDPEDYWQLQFAIRKRQQDFVTRYHMKTLEVPDMAPLAEERYRTEKDKYALVPEQRMSSHILIMCKAGECSRKEKRPIVNKLLAQLQAGADFEALAAEHSDDPSGKAKGGKFDKWLKMGEPHVSPPYVEGVFAIDTVGGYSEVVATEFGLHIIRLDAIEESHYKTLGEVKPQIIATLEREYKELAGKEFYARFRLTDEARMNYEALDEIFEQYKPVDPLLMAAEQAETAAEQDEAVAEQAVEGAEEALATEAVVEAASEAATSQAGD